MLALGQTFQTHSNHFQQRNKTEHWLSSHPAIPCGQTLNTGLVVARHSPKSLKHLMELYLFLK